MKKPDFSRKILKILSEKTAISLPELKERITTPNPLLDKAGVKNSYALNRSLKGLREAGLVESVHSGQNDYARLTREGKRKAASIKLEGGTTLVNPSWDGKWRIVLLDLPERAAAIKARTPMARYGQVEELVGAAIFLAAGAGSFVTGETVAVDGGFLAKGI